MFVAENGVCDIQPQGHKDLFLKFANRRTRSNEHCMSKDEMTDQTVDHSTDRPTWPAVFNGFRCKCPNCGKGKLLHSYLKVNDTCTECGQELFHHRADDGPAYLTILVVGHLLAPTLHVAFVQFRPDPMTLFTIFALGCVGLSLYLLPRLKGVVVAYQWARRMHGFGKSG